MVLNKIKNLFNGNDEKYEELYYRYSQVKLKNSKLKSNHISEKLDHKESIQRDVANLLIKIYQDIEVAKHDSFKLKNIDRDVQNLMLDINKIEKSIRDAMRTYSVEETDTNERFYDPELHQVASYEDAKGMAKGLVIKTVKKGFKYKNKVIKKPRVVVTK